MIFEFISEHATPRKCCVCMRGATLTGFKQAKVGGRDWSSKRYFCDEHAVVVEKQEAPVPVLAEPVGPSV